MHVGFAISSIDEEEAKATLAYLEELGELQAELARLRKAGHEAFGRVSRRKAGAHAG